MGEHHYLEVALSQANSTMVGVPNDQWFFCQATQKPICWRCFHPWPFVSQKCDWRPWNHLMLQCVRGSSVVVTKLSISNHIESYHSSSKIAPFQPQLKMLKLNPEYLFFRTCLIPGRNTEWMPTFFTLPVHEENLPSSEPNFNQKHNSL